MTHGFDDQGRQYDHQGNLSDWWEKADAEEYERRVAVQVFPSYHPTPGPTPGPDPGPDPNPTQVAQAGKVEVHGKPLNGKLTCGENIADLGGLKLAYKALVKAGGKEAAGPINGFTPTQRFFLAWAQLWRSMAAVPLGGTPVRPLGALLMAPGGSALRPSRGTATGCPATASGARASRPKAAHVAAVDHVGGGRTSQRSRRSSWSPSTLTAPTTTAPTDRWPTCLSFTRRGACSRATPCTCRWRNAWTSGRANVTYMGRAAARRTVHTSEVYLDSNRHSEPV